MKFLLLLIPSLLVSKDPDRIKVSEALGNLVGQNLKSMSSWIDVDALVRGFQEGCEGKDPSFNEEDFFIAFSSLQEEAFLKLAAKNLTEAEQFLLCNQMQPGVVEIEKGKLQISIQQEGLGDVVESHHCPLVKYKGKLLNGEIFGVSEETLSLDSLIKGLSKGVQGMREGEKRTLYVHPDLGFGSEDLSMPNALLIFEVELLRVDNSSGEIPLSNQELCV
jgi:peptidylprolyl isomerase